MHKFYCRSGKATIVSVMLGLFGLLLLGAGITGDSLLSMAIGTLCIVGAGKSVMDAMSQVPTLEIRRDAILLKKTWGGQQVVPWQDVQGVGIEAMTLRYWGIIPVGRVENLVVRCNGGMFGTRRLRISLKMLDMPPGGTQALMHLIHQAHVAAVGEAAVVMAGAGEGGWGAGSATAPRPVRPAPAEAGEEQGGFDADAALARYMARREAAHAAAAGPAPAMSPRPIMAARAGFGRKAV